MPHKHCERLLRLMTGIWVGPSNYPDGFLGSSRHSYCNIHPFFLLLTIIIVDWLCNIMNCVANEHFFIHSFTMLRTPSNGKNNLCSYAKKPSWKKFQARMGLEPLTCEIALHTALQSELSISWSWAIGNSVLYPNWVSEDKYMITWNVINWRICLCGISKDERPQRSFPFCRTLCNSESIDYC